MSTRTLVVLAAILFALTVLVRAPARWLLAAVPKSIDCQEATGSVWSGTCSRLQAPGVSLTDVSWTLHPLSLALGRLDVELRSADARAPARARVTMTPTGKLRLQDLHAELPVDAGLLPLFPAGWSGQVQLALDGVELDHGRLAGLRGTAVARSLAQQHPAMPFGSYELRFDGASRADGAIVGALRDLGGPLAVSGTLAIRNGHEYELNGLASARPDATPELAKVVEYLGPADAQGRRSYSLAGSF
jgi:hypothetical protein